MNIRVFVAVGEEVSVSVAVGLGVYVGVVVNVGINSANAWAVSSAAIFALAKACSAIFSASRTIGSSNVGSDNATADAPQNRLNPRMLAAKIHKRPA